VNVVLAVFFAHGKMEAGECIWYITNFTITVACGLVILSLYMRLHNYVVDKYDLSWLKSGEYGEPPQLSRWLVQMLHWGVVCCLEKFFTAIVVIFPLRNWIDAVISRAEEPLLPYPHVELVIVMVVCPSILNSLFAWIVDNLIKDKDVRETLEEDAPVTVDFEEESSVVGEGCDLE
jgi:cytochrome b subunit of formate dehydrogenase